MKRTLFTLCLVLSLLGAYTVVEMTVTPQYAEARSRMGGRSFKMSRPAYKKTPPRQNTNRMNNQRGGFSRGLMGGLLGGALGGLLFGSMFGGHGMGLLPMLLLAGGAWYLWRRFNGSQGGSGRSGQWNFPGQNGGRQRNQGGQSSQGGQNNFGFGSRQSSQQGGFTPDIGSGLGSQGRSQADSQTDSFSSADSADVTLEDGLAQIREHDRKFDENYFVEVASDVFFQVQAGWMRRDLSSYRHLLGDALAREYEQHFAEMKAKGIINKLESIAIRSVKVVAAGSDGAEDFVTVRFTANLLDYTVSDTSGELVDGDMNTPVKFDEEWSWARPVGTQDWKLEGIH